eukprot:CAMPEP_0168538056 /NCGR_PEP_ID=MMETSP0405-20121227/20818_1 /TAXON_ID=498012 /ORGANISM="Trichosphaerium sp, Strain Am-I-7 wt" /LENGTH=265 /DNA_ID=CAMNT_0008566981 /DNA_START=12 /DNA_END=809 /DNA_ORIENTATION=-
MADLDFSQLSNTEVGKLYDKLVGTDVPLEDAMIAKAIAAQNNTYENTVFDAYVDDGKKRTTAPNTRFLNNLLRNTIASNKKEMANDKRVDKRRSSSRRDKRSDKKRKHRRDSIDYSPPSKRHKKSYSERSERRNSSPESYSAERIEDKREPSPSIEPETKEPEDRKQPEDRYPDSKRDKKRLKRVKKTRMRGRGGVGPVVMDQVFDMPINGGVVGPVAPGSDGTVSQRMLLTMLEEKHKKDREKKRRKKERKKQKKKDKARRKDR